MDRDTEANGQTQEESPVVEEKGSTGLMAAGWPERQVDNMDWRGMWKGAGLRLRRPAP